MLAKILGPSECGADYRITYERSGTVVTHDKSAAKPAAQVAAKPAAGEPIPVAPVGHVQLFRVKYSLQKKWHTEPVSQ